MILMEMNEHKPILIVALRKRRGNRGGGADACVAEKFSLERLRKNLNTGRATTW